MADALRMIIAKTIHLNEDDDEQNVDDDDNNNSSLSSPCHRWLKKYIQINRNF